MWSDARSGEKIASIDFEASLTSQEHAWWRLRYIDDGQLKDYRVQIEASPCHYGGMRWWWVCPISGQRVAKLYLSPGATVFAARQTYRLAYRSQRDAKIDRTHARQRRLYSKLGGEYDYFEQPPPNRPKGMHHRTYERLIADLYAAMEVHEWVFISRVSAFLARQKKAHGEGR
jgi:hypothetical protein